MTDQTDVPDGFHDLRREPRSEAERLFGLIQLACAGTDSNSAAQALLDSLVVAIAWSFDTPAHADAFIDALPFCLKREVRSSWETVRDPANRLPSAEVGHG